MLFRSGNDEADAWETITNWGRPTVEDNPIYANLRGKGPAQEVRTGEIFSDEGRRRGGSVKGTGQKVRKKNLAIALAKAKADRERLQEKVNHLQKILEDVYPDEPASDEEPESLPKMYNKTKDVQTGSKKMNELPPKVIDLPSNQEKPHSTEAEDYIREKNNTLRDARKSYIQKL